MDSLRAGEAQHGRLRRMSMTLSNDPWIAEHSIIDPERLHALGVITLWWNLCERDLFFIFCHVFGVSSRVGWIIAHDLGDISISTIITEKMKLHPPDPDIATLIENTLKVYNVCRIKRNTLTHFTGQSPPDDPKNLEKVFFVRMKGPSGKPIPIPSSKEDIRQVALEIKTFGIYLWNVHKALAARAKGESAELPPLITEPELLVKPLPQNPPKQKRPPRPSPASRRKKPLR